MDRVRVDWQGGEGRPAVFIHANGFPPLAYRPFLEQLAKRLRVTALATRPLTQPGPPEESVRWSDLGMDVARWLQASSSPPVVAIGHSMGGTGLMYAVAAHPERFAGLVFLEPALLGPIQARLFAMIPQFLIRRIQPVKGAVNKRDTWPDEAAFRSSCDRSGLYRRVPDASMDAFVAAAIRPVADGVSLVFPKEWEVHFYRSAPCPAGALAEVSVPVVGIRGQSSQFLDDRRWALCTARQPEGWFTQLERVGHLLPLEDPVRAADALFRGLDAHGL